MQLVLVWKNPSRILCISERVWEEKKIGSDIPKFSEGLEERWRMQVDDE